MRNLKPIFIENSSVPKILSFFAPITISAIAIFPFVFSREKLLQISKRHETIHFQQQLETGVVGFYLIYLWDFITNLLKGHSGVESYLKTRAEEEAYAKQSEADYLLKRSRWQWLRRKR